MVAILAGLAAALGVSALLIATAKADVATALSAIYRGAFGDWETFGETLVQATPLIFTGLAMVVAFRVRVWNIGAEGQFFAGAMAAIWFGLHVTGLPRPVLLLFLVLASMAAGAVWAFIPGWLRAKFGASEIIVTVMMNYLIMYLLSYLLSGPWRDPNSFYLQSSRIPDHAHFPALFEYSRLHMGFILALLATLFSYVLLWKTPLGYEFRAIGSNPTAARYKGIPIERDIVLVMLVSGALAGLAGGSEILGLHHRLRLDISPGYGYTGIIIALLGRLHPVGVILAAVLFGALVNGSTLMQVHTGVPVALVYSVQGIILIFVLASEALCTYRIRRIAPHAG